MAAPAPSPLILCPPHSPCGRGARDLHPQDLSMKCLCINLRRSAVVKSVRSTYFNISDDGTNPSTALIDKARFIVSFPTFETLSSDIKLSTAFVQDKSKFRTIRRHSKLSHPHELDHGVHCTMFSNYPAHLLHPLHGQPNDAVLGTFSDRRD